MLGLLLTTPVYVLLVTNLVVRAWSTSEASYTVFQPLLHALGSVGGEQNEDIITAVWLLLSFGIALVITVLIVNRFIRRRRGARP